MEDADSGNAELLRAVADLWTQVVQKGDDYVVFYDHDGGPARVRSDGPSFHIGWVEGEEDDVHWTESPRVFDNPREAALHAFQGMKRGL